MQLRITLLLIGVLLTATSFAQLNNDMLKQTYVIEPQDSNTLWMGVRALGFNKNNEYTNDIADGYTLFGYQISPYLAYRAGEHVRIDIGVFLQQDFGNDEYTSVLPTFSIKYNDGGHYIVFGSLENAYNHNLIEPLYDFEKGLIDRLEYGLQGVFNRANWDLDVWLSWEKMIYPNDPNQEELVGGVSYNYYLKKTDEVQWSIPVQLIVYHKGGQIDLNPNPLVTTTNLALGVSYEKALSGKLSSRGMDHYYVGSKDFSNTSATVFESGNALYLNTTLKMKSGLEFQGSYWNGNGYESIQGGKLYSSVSSTVKTANTIEKNRSLLILRCLINKKIANGLDVSIRFEPLYDLGNGVFEFSHGMHLSFTPEVFLTKIKNVRY
jgi:hypothetical protein